MINRAILILPGGIGAMSLSAQTPLPAYPFPQRFPDVPQFRPAELCAIPLIVVPIPRNLEAMPVLKPNTANLEPMPVKVPAPPCEETRR